MPARAELIDWIFRFLEQGGGVLLAIMLASLLLWLLLLERYWFFRFDFPRLKQSLEQHWQPYRHRHDWLARQQRETLLEGLEQTSETHLSAIAALTQILPLLGLLGTVIGMIETFDVITVFGTGNARGLASGISRALITTLSGLITALPGLYFGADLKQRALLAVEQAEVDLD